MLSFVDSFIHSIWAEYFNGNILVLIAGRHAFIGMGFTDRGDSFDFNVALQDHFKYVDMQIVLSCVEFFSNNFFLSLKILIHMLISIWVGEGGK